MKLLHNIGTAFCVVVFVLNLLICDFNFWWRMCCYQYECLERYIMYNFEIRIWRAGCLKGN